MSLWTVEFVRAFHDLDDALRVLTQRDERDDKGRLRWLRADGSRP